MMDLQAMLFLLASCSLTALSLSTFYSSSAPKRKINAIELVMEERAKARGQMEAELNAAKVEAAKMDVEVSATKIKAERLGAIMALARELRNQDENLSFSEAMKEAQTMYEAM
ncbi:unnamed protein product [Tilletia controversa]|nr:unnamed protein product [Tilletia controversa]